jgi:class 3 adenylate cyclase
MSYTPEPRDTADVQLPNGIIRLTEQLASNAHENWAAQRIKDGWKYGPSRDDVRKEHPGLVPYEELPESEREYDRRTAMETVRAIISLGFKLEREDDTGETDASSQFADALEAMLGAVQGLDLSRLISLWSTRDNAVWEDRPILYSLISRRFLEAGEPLMACDAAREGLKCSPSELRLSQQYALALARSGAARSAQKILQELYHNGHRDEETVGLLARTHKDLWSASKDGPEGQKHLELALKLYLEAYQSSGGYWTGINAATLALAAGQRDLAVKLAQAVKGLCLIIVDEKHSLEGQYWEHATLGEACLILNENKEAWEWYRKAVKIAGSNYGLIGTSRSNLTLLLKYLKQPETLLTECLPLPRVAVLAESGAGGCLPLEGFHELSDALLQRLKITNSGIVYSGAGRVGAAFMKAAQDLKAEAHLVLPCRRELLLDSLPEEGNCRRIYREFLERSTEVVIASEELIEESEHSQVYAQLLVGGLALLRARHLQTGVTPMAVNYGSPETGRYGERWQPWEKLGLKVEEVSAGQYHTGPEMDGTMIEEAKSRLIDRDETGFKTRLVGLLFADAVGFSKLGERDIKNFIRHFWGAVSNMLAESGIKPLMKNTWGDGLFMVFDSLKEAGTFALDLCEMANGIDWETKGLPKNFNLRVALHAGPVYEVKDPITGIRNYLGSHVSKAARIEPITPPGQVYASQAFAALSAMGSFREFNCEYVGQIPLAKGYGTFPMYHLINAK